MSLYPSDCLAETAAAAGGTNDAEGPSHAKDSYDREVILKAIEYLELLLALEAGDSDDP